ncbi:uncharacterized protein [Lepeophtheirus salmonis]|uniref:uncharacterized protein isoform X1 n=1 Tax=Lepeophtheirus salmonis TaxID=72036 RepID=UPI001AEB7AB6|nr:uncharacterized protein DDB_G0284459-like isoform X1 [Lepeophtheirus salmonis]
MEEAIKLLVFDFINFISFLKKQPNVPKSWLSRIKRLELKCDNLGLTSKSTPESPPVINLPHSVPDSSGSNNSTTLSPKSSAPVVVDVNYVSEFDKDDLSLIGPNLNEESSTGHHHHLNSTAKGNAISKWSLKPEECDRDLLMEHSIKIGKVYVKNFKNLISSTLGKKVEKTALLTNDFRFLLYKPYKAKIDIVLDIRGALIQNNKLKRRRFTISCSTDKMETMEFEASDEQERDAWVYVLYQASKGKKSNDKDSSSNKNEDDIYQKVQEYNNYNLIEDDDDMNFDGSDMSDPDDEFQIYKTQISNRPVEPGDYRLVDDDTDEDFEDDIDFDQGEIDLLPSPPTPNQAESQYEFEDTSSYTSSSSDSSLSLCSPVDTSEFIEEPPSLPLKNQGPLKAPTDIPPRSKCLLKSKVQPPPCPLDDFDDEDFPPPPSPELPPELPPKNRTLDRKASTKKKSKILSNRGSLPIESSLKPHSKRDSSHGFHSNSSEEHASQRSSLMSTSSAEVAEIIRSRHSTGDKRPDPPPIPEEPSPKTKSKMKISMPKKFFKNSNNSKSYDINPQSHPSSDLPLPSPTNPPPPARLNSMEEIKRELAEKIQQRNKRMQLRRDNNLDDIKSIASSETKDIEFLGKKPSQVIASPAGVKPQVLKPKPLLGNGYTVGKVTLSSSSNVCSNKNISSAMTHDPPQRDPKNQRQGAKFNEVQQKMESLNMTEGFTSDEEDDFSD